MSELDRLSVVEKELEKLRQEIWLVRNPYLYEIANGVILNTGGENSEGIIIKKGNSKEKKYYSVFNGKKLINNVNESRIVKKIK